MSIKDDFNALKLAHRDARAIRMKFDGDMRMLTQEKSNARIDLKLSNVGKMDAIKRIEEKITARKYAYEDEISEVLRRVHSVGDGIISTHGARFAVNPDTIDGNALELLKAGVLTDSELIAMSKKYSDNVAMLRLIGKYCDERAKQNGNHELATIAVEASHAGEENPITDAVNTLIWWTERSTKGSEIDTTAYANHYDEQYDELVTFD